MQRNTVAYDSYIRLCRSHGALIILPLLERAGTVAYNFGRYGGQGGWYGSPTMASQGDIFGYGTVLDGSDDRAEVADDAALDTGDTVSIEAWVRRARTGTTEAIASRGGGSLYLRFKNTNSPNMLRAQFTDMMTSVSTITNTSSFYHLIASKNGASTGGIFLNGVDVSNTWNNDTLTNVTTQFCAGGSYQPTLAELFNGTLVFVAYYGRQIVAGEARRHYLAGKNGIVLSGKGR